MKKSSSLLLALLAGALCAGPTLCAATFRPQGTAQPGSVPGGINYQGRLNESGIPVTSPSPWGFVFQLYGSATGADKIGPQMPTSANIVTGLFSVTVPVTTDTLVGGGQRWLEVEIDKPGIAIGSGQKMTPREQLFSMPYALVAKTIEGTIDISTGGFNISTSPTSTPIFTISSVTLNTGLVGSLHMSSGTLTIDGNALNSIITTGRVGIGAANPATLLHMSSGTLTIDGNNPLALTTIGSVGIGINGPANRLDVSGAMAVGSGAGYAGTAAPANGAIIQGNVGIGTTAPGYKLEVNGETKAANFYALDSGGFFSLGATEGLAVFSASHIATLATSGSERLRIDSSGNVGVGTASPGTTLDVNGGATIRGQGTIVGTVTVQGSAFSVGGSTLAVSGGTLSLGNPLAVGSGGTGLNAATSGGVLGYTGGAGLSWSPALTLNGVVYGQGAGTTPTTTAQPGLNTVLFGSNGAPSWTNTPTLTGTNFTGVPGSGLTTLNTIGTGAGAVPAKNGGTGADLSGGAAGGIPYFSATGVMSALGQGTQDYALTSNVAGAPQWTDMSLGTTVKWATNLAGGGAGQLPYQSAVKTTSMLAAGTAGQLLQSGGAGAPAWTTTQYPGTSGASGTLLRSNGTNWVNSQAAFPNTVGASQILYSNGANNVAGLTTVASGVLVTDGSGVPSIGTTLPAVSGVNLTSLVATQISAGTFPSGIFTFGGGPGTGGVGLPSVAKATLKTTGAGAAGRLFYCNDCTNGMVVVSTGTGAASQYANAAGGQWQ